MVSIEGQHMRIRWDDGQELDTDVHIQGRILENMAGEQGGSIEDFLPRSSGSSITEATEKPARAETSYESSSTADDSTISGRIRANITEIEHCSTGHPHKI